MTAPAPLVVYLLDDLSAGDARAAGAAFLFRKPVDGRALLDAIEWVTDPAGHRTPLPTSKEEP